MAIMHTHESKLGASIAATWGALVNEFESPMFQTFGPLVDPKVEHQVLKAITALVADDDQAGSDVHAAHDLPARCSDVLAEACEQQALIREAHLKTKETAGDIFAMPLMIIMIKLNGAVDLMRLAIEAGGGETGATDGRMTMAKAWNLVSVLQQCLMMDEAQARWVKSLIGVDAHGKGKDAPNHSGKSSSSVASAAEEPVNPDPLKAILAPHFSALQNPTPSNQASAASSMVSVEEASPAVSEQEPVPVMSAQASSAVSIEYQSPSPVNKYESPSPSISAKEGTPAPTISVQEASPPYEPISITKKGGRVVAVHDPAAFRPKGGHSPSPSPALKPTLKLGTNASQSQTSNENAPLQSPSELKLGTADNPVDLTSPAVSRAQTPEYETTEYESSVEVEIIVDLPPQPHGPKPKPAPTKRPSTPLVVFSSKPAATPAKAAEEKALLPEIGVPLRPEDEGSWDDIQTDYGKSENGTPQKQKLLAPGDTAYVPTSTSKRGERVVARWEKKSSEDLRD
ncbi:hypothetical protein EJ06DRAFT_266224 [Trichodelitschia bisporula]|uniref:Uncharacterized protein n=1 Tax=Trichodelitschia bisporula TaxID=703511 RepID=A0A6G1HI25_9PEZI|nr:hypothetical protein EJ06DRAFT_266224 [Trichodelitschia bisporula]